MSYTMVHNMGQIPPCDKFRLGHQNDGAGHLYNVVCRTPHGMIPGKAKQGQAWYPFGGKEHLTHDFMFLQAEHGANVHLVRSRSAPAGALAEGHQNDGTYWVAVCHTNHGDIPGKAKHHEAWYPWGDKEQLTQNFSYVVVSPGRGFNPPQHGLYAGMTVHLRSKSHGQNLKIDQQHRVSGTGGNGEWATFMVHHRGGHHGSHHVSLSLARHPHIFLAIKNQQLTVGNGGPHCTFKVIGPHADGSISLESTQHHNQYVGILPNGSDKGPHQTGTGDHGRFFIVNAGSAAGREQPSRNSDEDFEFVPRTNPSAHIPGFNPSPHIPGFNPGPHIPGFNPGPHIPGFNPGPHIPGFGDPSFNPDPFSSGNVPGFNPSPNMPSQGLAAGMRVRFRSVKSGRSLRIDGCGNVDGEGGNGSWATFTTHVRGPGQYAFQNENNKWLAIKHDRLTNGSGDQHCTFLLHLNRDQTCSLESALSRGSHVGIKRSGKPKAPHRTRKGKPSSEFTIIYA